MASSSFSFFSFLITFTFLLLANLSTVAYAVANQTRETPPPPPPPPPPDSQRTSSAFKPGMAVVVGILTTMFSLTFLLLLYIKHCNGGATDSTGATRTRYNYTSRAATFAGRKNSGIDRSIVESLPIFRFGSLRGQKEGLDCAICLAKFESSEVLRLLPKCKHAFHVECVDTWLDAHSTCPLCRHQVDPEDILLVEDNNAAAPVHPQSENEACSERYETRRVSGRHSWVGEKEGGFLEIIVENENETERRNAAPTSSFRRSLDSATCATTSKSNNNNNNKKWLMRPRKDGMLLMKTTTHQEAEKEKERRSTGAERRLEHRIIVSPTPKQCGYDYNGLLRGQLQRWSDVQPSDLLYLTSEMIISKHNNGSGAEIGGNLVINTRSMSEITGLSRFVRNGNGNGSNREEEQGVRGGRRREEGVVTRWLGWISRTQTQPAVR
ncbi:RING-H2 finger protein ATL43 [Arachis stenosperma]|uniref:RING-H2 finger protein ATL43 n=1 Tax=Arachis stenosperma TaxID=217475 RepID=UPI0025AC52B6|nr:RING-H2 finger protein ATL43 [Arachis stenosperma]